MIRKNKNGPVTGTVRRFLYVAWILALLLISSDDAVAKTATKVTPNRLIHESSPYLLQHATNPVDWYPWGEEAFEKARKEDKPIFLSIGYSTCHWCHVMAHESFADEEVAA
ncbi:MAG: thioredoxin domain-containing protein, partial [Desulfobacterales bacterium]|nr:thioredoxin domain-containing protein [Desulfobacterales bacterium]